MSFLMSLKEKFIDWLVGLPLTTASIIIGAIAGTIVAIVGNGIVMLIIYLLKK